MKASFLDHVVQKVPFGFSLINEDYIWESINESWLKIIEKNEDDVIGKNIFDIFPEIKDQLLSIFENAKETKKPFYAKEFRLEFMRHGILEKNFFSFACHPIYNDFGSFETFACVILEITDLIGIKHKIEDEEERLRLATESSHTATWDMNLQTNELVHSAYLSKIFGYSKEDHLNQQQFRAHILESDRINIVEKAFEEALKTGKYQYEARLKDNNGVEKWIATHGKIFHDQEGKPLRMVGVLQDITERKNNEILLQQQHHQLNTAMNATLLGTFDMDVETHEKYNFSPRFSEIFGYDPTTNLMDYKLLERHLDKDFHEIRLHALKQAQETGDLYYQTKINLADGSTKWVEFYGRLLQAFPGSKPYISGTVRDITENKNYEKNISESEKKYRFLADAMPQIVWIGESDGRLTYFNQATMDYSGRDYNTFLEARGWLDIVHPDEQNENVRLWIRSVTHKTPFSFEHRFRSKTGDYRWFLSRAIPQLDEFGNVKKWVGTSTDIDDMKRQDEHKNDFIKIANHELKTPVTTIKGYVQLLKKMRGDSEDKFLVNSLNTIENQVNKLNLLIGDLLDISRIESGKLPLVKDNFSLLKLVTETIEDIKASEPSHRINFELRHASDIEVFADKDRITQVLNNLLTNAIKYSPTAQNVDVELYIKDNSAVLSVQDFGIGMDESELEHIFERFYRVSGADEVTFPGFGIGLFIVKDIVERHQGKTWVKSEKNKGSKFFFSLPLFEN